MYYFLPFLFKKYESALTAENIILRLKNLSTGADWKLNSGYFTRKLSYKVLEGEFTKDSFCIVSTRYGLTYGRTSLFPRLLGRIERGKATNQTVVKIKIRPSLSGLAIIITVLILAFYILHVELDNGQVGQSIPTLLFIAAIYFSVMISFNKEIKGYLQLIESCIS